MVDDSYTTGEQLTVEQVSAMLDRYCKLLEEQGYEPKPFGDVDAKIGGSLYRSGKYDALNEAYWMCGEVRKLVRQGRWSKALRWIGFIQGVLWMSGIYSITELKVHNRVFPSTNPIDPDTGRMFKDRG